MPSKDLPSIGDKLELYNLSRSKEMNRYISQLLDIVDEKNFVISGPIKNRDIVPLYKNSVVEISYYKENRGKFFFEGIVKKSIDGAIYKLVIERTSELKKIQLRNFYRLTHSMSVVKIHKLKQGDIEKDIIEECITEDISGGGIGLLCNYCHDIDDSVELLMDLEKTTISIKGKVIRIDTCKNPEYAYTIGVKLFDLEDDHRELIIKFIFNQQRKLRKKGLI